MQLSVWSTVDEEDKTHLIQQEENAIKNQIILFISRIINMKTPIEFAGISQIITGTDTNCMIIMILHKS